MIKRVGYLVKAAILKLVSMSGNEGAKEVVVKDGFGNGAH